MANGINSIKLLFEGGRKMLQIIKKLNELVNNNSEMSKEEKEKAKRLLKELSDILWQY